MRAIRVAGVDIGTNSVRLLVAEVSGAAVPMTPSGFAAIVPGGYEYSA